jgi:hypothetical protein
MLGKKKKNVHLDWWSKTLESGPNPLLGYCFLDEAVRRYADDVIASEEEILKEGIGFVDGPAWLSVAKYFKKTTDERYEK